MKAVARSLAVLPVVALLTLAGCGAKDGDDATRRASADPVAASQGAGAAADLVKKSCKADAKGVWNFTGTLKNSREAEATYTVTVSVVNKAGSSVVASKQLVAKVPAGGTKELSEKKVATTKDSASVQCVVGVRAK